MCPLKPELESLTRAELDQSRGHLEKAKRALLGVLNSNADLEGRADLAARAAYRLAEIEEQTLWSAPQNDHTFATFLHGVHRTRAAFLSVTSYGDVFWSRRAAYRILTLMDEALARLQTLTRAQSLKPHLSPFSVLEAHLMTHASLDAHIAELENESRFLESTLLRRLNPHEDMTLIAALKQRDNEGMSLFFGDVISPPWAGGLPVGLIVKHNKSYFKISDKNEAIPLSRSEAISAMKQAVGAFANSVSFAFSLAHLTEEQVSLPEELVAAALKSTDKVVRLAGLYAAQRAPSPHFTAKLLDLWPEQSKRSVRPLFSTAQDFLFNEKERLLLALATHFALGRESTQMILASRLHDEEKAWLLQFRKDRTTVTYAESFLQHENATVKSRTQKALRAWHS